MAISRTELEIERAKREMLYLSDGDKEAEFIDFLADLMRQPEHEATAKLVWYKFTGRTAEEMSGYGFPKQH